MLKLKSRAVLETPTTGLSRQLSKTGINENSKEDQGQLLKANTNDNNNNNNNNNEASQQHGGGGLGPSQKPSIHRYQPRFAPSQQPPPLPYSQDGFDVADYCTPADQQFELVGNIAYANTKNSAGGGGGGSESQQGLQPFDSCDGKENGVSGKGYFSSIVQNTTNGKQFGMRSPVPLSPMRHKRARLGCIVDSPNVSQQMLNGGNYDSSRGAMDVINGGGGSSGPSGLRFQQLSSQQMQLTPRESSQPFTISRAGSLPQACLQYSQGGGGGGGGGNRNSANAHNSMFEVPPIPNRQQQQVGGANATKKEKLLQSPPISRNAFLRDEEQAKELPGHTRRMTNIGNNSNREMGKENAQMLRFRSEFADLGLIAKGGFGKVSRVVHRLDGKMYAIKRTEKKLYGESEKNDALREVHAMAALSSLNSPNIVRYYTSWMEYDHLYIQMELCERGAVKFGPNAKFTKNEGEVLLVVRDVASALSAAHDSEERIAHMDVKPDNIFESEKKIYKLGDWGRATSTCSEKRRKLIGGASEIDGDQRYLANEVLNDDFSNLAKSDVWSLGATALELMLGEALPMNGDKYRALRDGRSVNENFEDFGLNEFSCSDEMKALLKSMLAKDPESRPTAKEIMVECEKLLCLTSPLESSML